MKIVTIIFATLTIIVFATGVFSNFYRTTIPMMKGGFQRNVSIGLWKLNLADLPVGTRTIQSESKFGRVTFFKLRGNTVRIPNLFPEHSIFPGVTRIEAGLVNVLSIKIYALLFFLLGITAALFATQMVSRKFQSHREICVR